MRTALRLGLLAVVVVTVAGCLAGPNELSRTPDEEGAVAGFWKGLWQGIIAPITFIVSLFTGNVNFYEVHNNGNWYDFGFVLGAGILTGGVGGTARRRRRSRED